MRLLNADRRRFLTFCANLAGATLLERTVCRSVARADLDARRRFVAWYSGYGVSPHVWYPRGTTAATFADTAAMLPGTGPYTFTRHSDAAISVPLRATAGPGSGIVASATDSISECLDARLNPYLDSLLLVRGVDGTGLKWVGHNPFTAFSARYWPYEDSPAIGKALDSGGREVDATTTLHRPMVDSKVVYPIRPAHEVLCFRSGERNANHSPRLFIDVREGKLYELPTFFDPLAAWSAVFDPLLRGGTQQSPSRRMGIETALRRILALAKNSRLSASDRVLLEEKASVLDDVLNGSLSAERLALIPERPELPAKAVNDPGGWTYETHYAGSAFDAARAKSQIDLLVAAIKLDLCRVFGVLPMDNSAAFHAVSHNRVYGPQIPANLTHFKDLVERFSYLLEKLDVDEPGTGRTYLDNTLIQWHSDMGNISNHHQYDVLTLFAGGKGYVRAGRYLDLRVPSRRLAPLPDPETGVANDKRPHYSGRSHSEALIVAMRWMGLRPEEWEAYASQGLLQFCPRVGGYGNPVSYDYGDRRSPLPFATV